MDKLQLLMNYIIEQTITEKQFGLKNYAIGVGVGKTLIKTHGVINQPQCPNRTGLIFVFLGQPAFRMRYKLLYPWKISK